ncbi:hypothetical protein [Rhizobium ruizarguesonis]|uniref:hypothetical protein n=1 Tax=Rhizobium ruizarguesonis TaxID=2081791 RepID=UPI00102F6F22|nr:hypothetical protein [Rhizobium ruizarguesonis]TBC78003.1 hypothetical protein ELH30_08530 [Rhizobium ruizarguesonis]
MSVFYSIVYPDRVCILTDGGVYDAAGNLVATCRKVFPSPNLPFAVTCRASPADRIPEIIDSMDAWINRRADPLEKDRVLACLTPIEEFFHELGKREGTFPAEFLFAGFSKAAGPQHWLLFCHDREGVCPPFKLVHPGNDVQNGIGLTHEDLARHGISPAEIAKADFFARFGASFMAIARKKRAVMFGMSTPLHFVGGHCDLTTITEHGVTVERLCTWPDKLGRPIDPSLPMILPDGQEVAA